MSQTPQVNLFDPAFKANPYPTYAQLRATAPIHRTTLPDGRSVWLVTRNDDVFAGFKDERFVEDWRDALTPEQLAQVPPIPEVMKPLSRNILATDSPDHTVARFGFKGVHTALGREDAGTRPSDRRRRC